MNTSKHDGYPVCDLDEAILILDDMISGADKDLGRDTRISKVIWLLHHLTAREVGRRTAAPRSGAGPEGAREALP